MCREMSLAAGFVALAGLISVILATAGCEPTQGDMEWKVTLGDRVSAAPAVGPDGNVYVGCNDRTVYVISPEGRVLRQSAPTRGPVYAPVIGDDGTIYASAADGSGCSLYALTPELELKWGFGGGGNCVALAADGTVYARGTFELHALRSDGTEKWVTTPPSLWGRFGIPAIGSDGTIFVGCDGYDMMAVDPDSGGFRWKYGRSMYVDGTSAAIGANGHVYALASDSRITELEPDSGTVIGYFEFGATAPIISSDGIYSWNSSYKALYRIPASGGSANSLFSSSGDDFYPPAIAATGDIYVSSRDTFYVLSSSGQVKRHLPCDEAISTAPTIGLDGTVYFGAGASLYAMRGDGRYPTNQPWPMYRQNCRHTGRAE